MQIDCQNYFVNVNILLKTYKRLLLHEPNTFFFINLDTKQEFSSY